MQAGRRRRRRPPPVSVLWAALAVAALLVTAAAGFALWRVLPLLDRGAGTIPPSALTGVAPSTGGGGAPSGPVPLSAAGASRRPIPGVRAAAAIVVDAQSGKVLWLHHPHVRRPVASLTKLMTALLAEQRGGLARRFTITAPMTGELGYTLGLRVGQRVTVRDMLAAMMIGSANDAADALAVRRSGSMAAFV